MGNKIKLVILAFILGAGLLVFQRAQAATCNTWNQNLRIGDKSEKVAKLVTVLINEGFLSVGDFPTDTGSLEFTEKVASAVVGFQEKYASEILTPNGLLRGTGYVGPSTRAKISQLYGCNIKPENPISPVTPVAPITPKSIDSQNPGAGLKLASNSSIQAYYMKNTVANKVGPWGRFYSDGANDFVFKVVLNLNETKTIKSILQTTEYRTLAGFTSNGLVDGIGLFPLVVEYNGKQLNTAFDQQLGTYNPGKHTLYVYGENANGNDNFNFGITVYFTDGTYLSSQAARVSGNYPEIVLPVTPTNPTISITSPISGEKLQVGASYIVSWQSNEVPLSNRVVAYLQGNTSPTYVKIGSGYNSGSMLVKIPTDIPGEGYNLQVLSNVNGKVITAIKDVYVVKPLQIMPVTIPQTISPQTSSIESGNTVKFTFSVPNDVVSARYYVYCPAGVTIFDENKGKICNSSQQLSNSSGNQVKTFQVFNSVKTTATVSITYYVSYNSVDEHNTTASISVKPLEWYQEYGKGDISANVLDAVKSITAKW